VNEAATLDPAHQGLRRAAIIVALANLAYFGVEFAVARKIGAVSLFADSADFFEDAAVNLLIVYALGLAVVWRARIGTALAAVLLFPAIAALYTAWRQLTHGSVPDPELLTITGFGALVVNTACAFLLARHRHTGGSLGKAAFLSARNDAAANIAIMTAGLVSAYLWHSIWPDLIVGGLIFAINLDAAGEVYEAAKAEKAKEHVA